MQLELGHLQLASRRLGRTTTNDPSWERPQILTVPPLSISAVRMADCFSKVMSASVPFFFTEVSLPQKLSVSTTDQTVDSFANSREEIRQLGVGGLGSETGNVDGVTSGHCEGCGGWEVCREEA